jgi:mRNA-degrading endonuclease RelE of RelBE toxin-antitoxin system
MIHFVESPLFSKLVYDYLDEIEYYALQWELAAKPEIGDVIKGIGGIRKLRWGAKGKGKRGGVRIIYYWKKSDGEVLLLTLYAKNEAADIAPAQLKKLKQMVMEGL